MDWLIRDGAGYRAMTDAERREFLPILEKQRESRAAIPVEGGFRLAKFRRA